MSVTILDGDTPNVRQSDRTLRQVEVVVRIGGEIVGRIGTWEGMVAQSCEAWRETHKGEGPFTFHVEEGDALP